MPLNDWLMRGRQIVRIPVPDWFKYLTGQDKLDCLNLLDSGKEVVVDVDYGENGSIVSAKLVREVPDAAGRS